MFLGTKWKRFGVHVHWRARMRHAAFLAAVDCTADFVTVVNGNENLQSDFGWMTGNSYLIGKGRVAKINRPNLFAPCFSAKRPKIKQFGRLISA